MGNHFEVGTRVRITDDGIRRWLIAPEFDGISHEGTIKCIDFDHDMVSVEFDELTQGHDGIMGECLYGHGWNLDFGEFEVIDEPEEIQVDDRLISSLL